MWLLHACLLLPLSKVQIQISYSQLTTSYAKAATTESVYPGVFNMTILESVVGYSTKNNGLMFYFDGEKKQLANLIDNKLLQQALENMHLFVNSKSSKDKDKTSPSPQMPLSRNSYLTTFFL